MGFPNPKNLKIPKLKPNKKYFSKTEPQKNLKIPKNYELNIFL